MLEGKHTNRLKNIIVSKLHRIVLFCLANKTPPFLSSSLPKPRDGDFLEGLRLCSPEPIIRLQADPAFELSLARLYLSSFKQAPSTPNQELHESHRITEQFGLEVALKITQSQAPTSSPGRDMFQQTRWLRAPSNLAFNTPRKGHPQFLWVTMDQHFTTQAHGFYIICFSPSQKYKVSPECIISKYSLGHTPSKFSVLLCSMFLDQYLQFTQMKVRG